MMICCMGFLGVVVVVIVVLKKCVWWLIIIIRGEGCGFGYVKNEFW